jgi:hypothetical protein
VQAERIFEPSEESEMPFYLARQKMILDREARQVDSLKRP